MQSCSQSDGEQELLRLCSQSVETRRGLVEARRGLADARKVEVRKVEARRSLVNRDTF